jgi:regulatory protein
VKDGRKEPQPTPARDAAPHGTPARTGRISAIVLEKTRTEHRAAIYVDDRLAAYARPRDAQGLAAGDTVTEQSLNSLQQGYQDQGAYLQAIRFLGPRDRSTREVRRHLHAKGWNGPACDRAVAKLEAEGYLDDRAFARKWVAFRARTSPRSRRTLIQELNQKGIARETVTEAVANVDEDALALACAQKKIRHWQRYAGDERFKRIAAFLQRKGFPADVCRNTARIVTATAQND